MIFTPYEPKTPQELLSALLEKARVRARQIYENGSILFFEKVTHENFFALVKGNQTYEVSLFYLNEVIFAYRCDCPAEKDPVCKHIGAVLYHIQEHKSQIATERSAIEILHSKLKTENYEQHKRFMEFLLHNNFERWLLCTLPDEPDSVFAPDFEERLLRFAKAACARNDLTYQQPIFYTVYSCLKPFLESALQWVFSSNYSAAYTLLCSVLRIDKQILLHVETIPPPRHTVYSAAIRILTELAIRDLDEEFRQYLYADLWRCHDQRLIFCHDYYLLRVMCHLAPSEKAKKEIQFLLNRAAFPKEDRKLLESYLAGKRLTKEEFRKELLEQEIRESIYPYTHTLSDYGAQCKSCIRYFHSGCEAFPDGIPEEIMRNQFLHHTPYPGDGGLLFECRV